MYHNEHVLNWDKISCRKIPLNIGSLFQNFICTGYLSILLQLLILNKAYYLEIKIGLITRNLTKFLHPAAILELFLNRKRRNAGSLCIKHGTLSIVSHYITLHHIVSRPNQPTWGRDNVTIWRFIWWVQRIIDER